jgi:hypothetical protein
MDIITYKTNDLPNKIQKTLSQQGIINGKYIISCKFNSLSCEVILNYPNFISNFAQVNYMSISFNSNEVTRYYFIESFELMSAERIKLNLALDVLMTYQSQILNLECLISRQENIKPNFVRDDLLPLKNEKTMKIIEFSDNEFNLNSADENSYNFILNVSGGGTGNAT